jgi:purine-binding chemotaxis protein CheW
MSDTRQFCTFFVDGMHLGIEVLDVQEVLRVQPMTRVPLSSPMVRGLINLRGQIVTALDLRRRFGLPARADERPPMNVVVRTADGAVSLLVDEIGDVLDVEVDRREAPPRTLTGTARDLIRAVYKLDGELLLALDLERTLAGAVAGADHLDGLALASAGRGAR